MIDKEIEEKLDSIERSLKHHIDVHDARLTDLTNIVIDHDKGHQGLLEANAQTLAKVNEIFTAWVGFTTVITWMSKIAVLIAIFIALYGEKIGIM